MVNEQMVTHDADEVQALDESPVAFSVISASAGFRRAEIVVRDSNAFRAHRTLHLIDGQDKYGFRWNPWGRNNGAVDWTSYYRNRAGVAANRLVASVRRLDIDEAIGNLRETIRLYRLSNHRAVSQEVDR